MIGLVNKSVRQAKKVIVTVVGFTILLMGVLMIVLPGPAVIFIPAGIGILATEYVWARRLLVKVKNRASGKRGDTASDQ